MTIPGIRDPAIPVGSWIVVTGITGFIGSHVADQALAAGYHVRGIVRDVEKAAWVDRYFESKYGPGRVELVEVPDMAAEHAFHQAVIGATGFIHVAHDMTFSTDAKIAVSRAVRAAINALEASASSSTVRRVVYTSSSFAVTFPKPGERFTVSPFTFNEEAVKRAFEPDADGGTVYAASKVEAERAIFKWLAANKDTAIVVNIVIPDANFGPLISSTHQGYRTTAGWVQALWNSDYGSLKDLPAQQYVNVQDTARLHIIGLVDPSLWSQRIFAIAGPANFQQMVSILRKHFPGREWKDFPHNDQDQRTFDGITRADQLLQAAYGSGFIPLEESIVANAAELADNPAVLSAAQRGTWAALGKFGSAGDSASYFYGSEWINPSWSK